MVTFSAAKFQDCRIVSPTSSLELIVSPKGGSKAKATSKVSIASFWENVGTATQKAHYAISMEDLEPLMGKPPSKLMSSHVHKLMQVCVLVSYVRLFFFFFYYHLFVIVGDGRVLVHL